MNRKYVSRLAAVLPVASLLFVALGSARGQEGQVPAPPTPVAPEGQAPAGMPPGDPLGPDLFVAIRNGSLADMKALLARGAKPNATNFLGVNPLMWAAVLGNEPACKALIAAGANVNGPSPIGNVLMFGEMGGNVNVVRLLLAHGARPSKDRPDQISPLMTAADSGHVDILRVLLANRITSVVNTPDSTGATALIHAAKRGQTRAARVLLDAGANVNVKDKYGCTALMYAAQGGYPACTELLLSRHAQVDVRDNMGNTALLLAARYASDEPQIAQALLRAGANARIKNAHGETASVIAARMRQARSATTVTSEQTRTAAVRGLALIERSTKLFSDRATCVSCHHQGMGLMASGLARDRGFNYDKALAQMQTDLIIKNDEAAGDAVKAIVAHPETAKYAPGADMGELTPALAFTYSGLLAHDRKPGEVQSALTTILAGQQEPDGKWGFTFHREPMQSSVFATTALTIRLLQKYLPADRAAERTQRIQKASTWLASAKAATNEDKTWRLLGLKWANANPAAIAKASTDLRRTQRPDGGWAQLPVNRAGSDGGDSAFTRSDAHATGQALYALYQAGMPVSSDTYRRGVRYLLRTQDADGSWLVTKRAIPANNYMDAGFPHGQSQYASYNASCWATMALMLATKPQQIATRNRH